MFDYDKMSKELDTAFDSFFGASIRRADAALKAKPAQQKTVSTGMTITEFQQQAPQVFKNFFGFDYPTK